MRNASRKVRVSIAVGLSTAWVTLFSSHSYSDAPAGAPIAPVAVVDFRPLTYFETNCARCHGAYGKAYPANMVDRYTNETLRAKIEYMSNGPAQAPLEDAQLDILEAYQQSVTGQRPFVWTSEIKPATDGSLDVTGEVTPEAKVVISSGATHIDATVDGHTWSAKLPAGADVNAIHVTVTVAGATVAKVFSGAPVDGKK